MDRQLVGMRFAVMLFLPTVIAQSLAKVAIAIEQSHGDEREAEIAGRLQMIAGKDSESTGVKRERCVYAKLGTKVRDRMFLRNGFKLQVRLSSHVRLKARIETMHAFEVNGI